MKIETKHTPGPWYLSERKIAVKGHSAGGYSGASVATTSPSNTDETRQADARLIAAAPELLAVAEEYARTLTLARLVLVASNDTESLAQMDANLSRARAVISKAKGEES